MDRADLLDTETARMPDIGTEFACPMSLAQEHLWFIERLSAVGALFHLSTLTRLPAGVSPVVLERALNEIVRRHETLRTTFDVVDEVPSQVIHDTLRLSVPVVDLSRLPRAGREAEAAGLAEVEALRPFDLRTGPLLRATVFDLGGGEQMLAVAIHHLVSDGWSMGLFWRELTQLTSAMARGHGSPLPELGTQYADFAVWQRDQLAGPSLDRELAFWRETLAGLPPTLELPTDRPRPPVQTFRGALHETMLPPELVQAAGRLAHEEGATVFMVLLAGLLGVLHRYTGSDDLVVGTYTAGREQPETESIIGFFLNTLVLRTRIGESPTFRDVVRSARSTALDAYAHDTVPFATLVRELHPDRDPSRNPVFQVVFQMLNVPTLEQLSQQQREAAVPTRRTSSAFDLSFALSPDGRGGLELEVEYATDLYDVATVARLGDHYVTLLGSALAHPDAPVGDLDLIGPEERDWLLAAGRGDVVDEPGTPDLSALFDAQVAEHPDDLALRTPDGDLSYGDLDRAVHQLAKELTSRGVHRRDRVVVWLPRRGSHVTAMLAVWRVGAVYVPVAADCPPARTRRILDDLGATVLVTTTELAESLGEHPVPVVQPGSGPAPARRGRRTARVAADPDDVAYVIHTSGSTGRPKGVEVPHRQVLNRLRWMWRCHPFAADEVSCHKTAISFVDSLWEVLGPLLAGVPAVVLPEEVVRDPATLVASLAEERVTRLWLVPSLLSAILDTEPALGAHLPDLRFWVSSGEVLTVPVADRFALAHPDATLSNLYGTSEVWDATWWSPTSSDGRPGWRVPLGRPIDNVVVRVLDRHGRLSPVGVPGELMVGGAGLALGYLGDPALTSERFVPDPFAPGERLYRTLDVARWLPGGDLEFVARSTALVKVNGYRVDPAEVEEALAGLPGIRAAAVVPVETEGTSRLAAFVAPDPGTAPSPVELRQELARTLPRFMLPADIAVLPELPHTSSGKLDRAALPEPTRVGAANGPRLGVMRTEAERAIARVWRELLHADVGRDDNFFDLGGHSLLLVQVRERLLGLFDRDLSITDMFRYPTVAGLARHVDEQHVDDQRVATR